MQELLPIFPHINAALNSTSAVLLIIGFVNIRSGRRETHRKAMLGAAVVSTIFLASYLTHHAIRTYMFGLGPTKFTGEGIIRPIYFTILTSHTFLAAIVTPFVILTLYRGLKGQFDKHKRLARYVFPVWLYVSLTGVVVYLMLYQFFPAGN